ncbi:hypothetical protein HZI73_07035 [Vallitalea pronyensis]|uniref:Uncharacterized protein n=1 Tax=Vallitalea pronyensis TaxID=1348613 RepID=A0A8J8SJK1_9FIRM|nr:hypothetical protein HZI73_07035 [Vallitalea pronyensis]
MNLWLKIVVATVPARIVRFLFDEIIGELLYNSTTVALSLIIFGIEVRT